MQDKSDVTGLVQPSTYMKALAGLLDIPMAKVTGEKQDINGQQVECVTHDNLTLQKREIDSISLKEEQFQNLDLVYDALPNENL
eukprot:UN29427